MKTSHIINHTTISLIQGDITRQTTTAIVNAANSSLLGGGGVDGAIHRAAGPELLQETRTLNGCETGNAKITGGYNLLAKYVIHTVGPIYQRHDDNVPRLLASCYHESLKIAEAHNIASIAFPAISTGIYGYPVNEASEISLNAVVDYLNAKPQTCINDIRFVLFTESVLQAFASSLAKITRPS